MSRVNVCQAVSYRRDSGSMFENNGIYYFGTILVSALDKLLKQCVHVQERGSHCNNTIHRTQRVNCNFHIECIAGEGGLGWGWGRRREGFMKS